LCDHGAVLGSLVHQFEVPGLFDPFLVPDSAAGFTLGSTYLAYRTWSKAREG
jgi:hypothetical protein